MGKIVDVDIAYISPTGSVFLHVSAAGSKRLEELNRDLTEHYTSKVSFVCLLIQCYYSRKPKTTGLLQEEAYQLYLY